MDYLGIGQRLSDERCGLYFLAGLDTDMGPDGRNVLTVHAAQGNIGPEHEEFIWSTLAALQIGLEVRIRHHSPRDLYAPESLESFSNLFAHDRIVSDPTGAFTRVSKLPKLAGLIRSKLDGSVAQILWKAEASALVVVASPGNDGAVDTPERLDRLRQQLNSLIADHSCADMKRAVRSVQLCIAAPSGRHTPVDVRSCPPRSEHSESTHVRTRSLSGLLARISGIAALIGLGAISAVNAKTIAKTDDALSLMPGIAGLVGLTTLGENSYGLRNRYQAVGGLRLYFGDTGLLMLASARSCPMSVDELVQRGEDTWPRPNRVFCED